MRHIFQKIIFIVFLSAASILHAQGPLKTKTTEVMLLMTPKSGVTMEQIRKVLPEEVRATLQLYLDGKIQTWYSRSDGKGVILVMNCTSTAEAEAIADALPFAKASLVDHQYTELGPLAPLGSLLAMPVAAK